MLGYRRLAACVVAPAALVLVGTARADPSPVADFSVEATSATETVVTYPNTVPEGATCTPASGSTFPVGSRTVTCTSTDATTFTFQVTVTDTTPPSVTSPGDLTVDATSSAGATVSYAPTATDLVDGSVPVTCTPASGSVFPLDGTTTKVSCTAKDAAGNTSSPTTFTVTVKDTKGPVLTGVPAAVDAEATSTLGAKVDYQLPQATDAVDGSVAVTCSPPPGTTLPFGPTSVTCSAADKGGNTTTATFTVTVADTRGPALDGVPASFRVEATSAAGAAVTYPVPTAVDVVDGARPVACTPLRGSVFSIGDTIVTCTSSDARGNKTSADFTVTVSDTRPPTIVVPPALAVLADDANGAVVRYTVAGLDLVDGAITPSCAPASGTRFALGTTIVRCTAEDSRGNKSAPVSFVVTVVPRTPTGNPTPTPTPTPTQTPTPTPTPQPAPTPSQSVQPAALPPLAPVGGLAAHAGNRRVTVSWSAAASATGHVELARVVGSQTATVYSGRATTFVDAGLTNGVRYRYVIVAVEGDGRRSSEASVVAMPIATALTRPAAGALVTAPPVFGWARAAKATYYNLQLYRNGVKILSVWPTGRAFALKRSWAWAGKRYTFGAGSYHWYVWPGYGRQAKRTYGALLGDSVFQVQP